MEHRELNTITCAMAAVAAINGYGYREVAEKICRVLTRRLRELELFRCVDDVVKILHSVFEVMLLGKPEVCNLVVETSSLLNLEYVPVLELQMPSEMQFKVLLLFEALKLFADKQDLCRDIANLIGSIRKGKEFMECGSLDIESCLMIAANLESLILGRPPKCIPIIGPIPDKFKLEARNCVNLYDLAYSEVKVPRDIDPVKIYSEIYTWYRKAIPLLKILAYTRRIDPSYLYASYRYIVEYMPRPEEASLADIAAVAREILSYILEWGSEGVNNHVTMGLYAYIIDKHYGKLCRESKLCGKGLELHKSIKPKEVEKFLEQIREELDRNPVDYLDVLSISMCGKAHTLVAEGQRFLSSLIKTSNRASR